MPKVQLSTTIEQDLKLRFEMNHIGTDKSFKTMSAFIENSMKAHLDMPQTEELEQIKPQSLKLELAKAYARLEELKNEDKRIQTLKESMPKIQNPKPSLFPVGSPEQTAEARDAFFKKYKEEHPDFDPNQYDSLE